MTEHRITLTLTPVPAKYAALMRARGMTVPDLASGFHRAALIPYRARRWHRLYAVANGLFWLPCPLCGRDFGGHEIGDSIPDPAAGEGYGMAICPACTAERNGGQVDAR